MADNRLRAVSLPDLAENLDKANKLLRELVAEVPTTEAQRKRFGEVTNRLYHARGVAQMAQELVSLLSDTPQP